MGDRLISVDDIRTEGLSHGQIARLVRGPVGSRVLLGFWRPGADGGRGDVRIVALERRRPAPALQPAFNSHRDPRPTAGLTTFLVM